MQSNGAEHSDDSFAQRNVTNTFNTDTSHNLQLGLASSALALLTSAYEHRWTLTFLEQATSHAVNTYQLRHLQQSSHSL